MLALLPFTFIAASLLLAKCHFPAKPTGFKTLIHPKLHADEWTPANSYLLGSQCADTAPFFFFCFQKPCDDVMS